MHSSKHRITICGICKKERKRGFRTCVCHQGALQRITAGWRCLAVWLLLCMKQKPLDGISERELPAVLQYRLTATGRITDTYYAWKRVFQDIHTYHAGFL